ncbi:MAG: hydroxyacylglutathione hydrolase [Candidatus Binatia bacterium]
MRVIAIPQLSDNYAYLVIDERTQQAGIVDCADAEPVLAKVRETGVALVAILPTHHHWDHIGGNEALVHHLKLEVYGYAGQGHRIPGCTREVRDGESIQVGHLAARILFIPAHTSGHVAYYFAQEKAVFTGDTLFAGGCGRLFEGDAAMMLQSLSKLKRLPDDTKVYFGHEYTEQNLRFALTLEPDNAALREKHAWALEQRRAGQPTVPTTIASERATNPFFRAGSHELQACLHRQFPELPLDEVSVFAKTRALKDVF